MTIYNLEQSRTDAIWFPLFECTIPDLEDLDLKSITKVENSLQLYKWHATDEIIVQIIMADCKNLGDILEYDPMKYWVKSG